MVGAAKRESDGWIEFPRLVAFGVGDLGPDDLAPAELVTAARLSGWMYRLAVSREEALAGMSSLRDSLLDISGLDRRSEPVPLRTSDPAKALMIMAAYLEGLVTRAAAALESMSEAAEDLRERVLAEAVARLSA